MSELFYSELSSDQIKHIQELIVALRSGYYLQAKGRLKCGIGYCCLGVACQISNISEFKTREEGAIYEYLGIGYYLPIEVQAYYGFRDNGAAFYKDGENESLMQLNDSGTPFSEIADIIESELKLIVKELTHNKS